MFRASGIGLRSARKIVRSVRPRSARSDAKDACSLKIETHYDNLDSYEEHAALRRTLKHNP